MSQNGQSYTRRDVARLLKIKEAELMAGERGAVVEFLERRHGRLDRELVNRWVAMGAPTPSTMAGATGRMDYGLLMEAGMVKGLDVR